ncbi:hypothetical protein VNO77_49343 [Canavalia gladiata]|uniref:Uncharacterized protein n=1 Tax=Canavalia gladiata TaxID=3824 RepID=A0AAN9JEZ9_CANGL
MAGRKSYLEASYGCAKNMKETVLSSNPLERLSQCPDESLQADIDPASGVALHTTNRGSLGAHAYLCTVLFEKERIREARHARAQSYSKEEFDPGSEGTLAICLTHASRTLFSGSWAEGKEAPSVKVACLAQEVGTVENKVANGCVMRGNLPNSSGQILKKAKKRCLMSLRSIR